MGTRSVGLRRGRKELVPVLVKDGLFSTYVTGTGRKKVPVTPGCRECHYRPTDPTKEFYSYKYYYHRSKSK